MVKADEWQEKIEKELETAKEKGEISERIIELVSELRVHQSELEMQNEELKQSQDELSELYNQYHELYDEAPLGYFTLDKDGIIRDVNNKGTELLQLNKKRIIGRGFSRFVPKDCENRYYHALANAVHENQKLELQLKRNKILFYANMEIRPLSEMDGKYRITVTEITELKKAEEGLLKSEQQLRRFYESGLLGVIYWNMDGQIIDANDKFLEMMGYTREDLEAGQIDWINITPPEFQHLDESSMNELKSTGVNNKPFEKEYIRKDGVHIPIIVAGAMLDDECFNGVAFVLDITERKKAEEKINKLLEGAQQSAEELEVYNEELQATTEELQVSNEELKQQEEELRQARDYLEEQVEKRTAELKLASTYNRSLIEASLDPLVTIGPDGKITDVNWATELVTGYYRDELVGTDFSNYFIEPEMAKEGYQQVFQEGFVQDYLLEIKHKNGHITPVLYNATVYKDESGDITGVFAAARDITERKRAEEEKQKLLEQTQQFAEELEVSNEELQVTTEELQATNKELKFASNYNRSLIEASLDPLVTIGPDGKITDVNGATEAFTGYSRDELIGTDFSDYFTQPHKARGGYVQVFKEGWVIDYPLEIQHRNGHVTPVLYNASVYEDESGKVIGVFAAARDITELKLTEAERQKSLEHAQQIAEELETSNEELQSTTEELQSSNEELQSTTEELQSSNEELLTTTNELQVANKDLEFASKYNRSLIEASLDPLVTIGPDGKITDVNQSTEAVTGYSRDDLIGTDFCSYFTEPKKAKSGYEQVFKESKVLDYQLEIKHRNEQLTPVLYNASIYKDESGEVMGVFAAARDITELKNAEKLLREAIYQLKRSNKELQSFAYITSHDLQEPLRTIASFTQLLERRYKGQLDADADEFIDYIVNAAVRMKDMIQGLLEYSRVDTRGDPFKKFNSEEAVNHALDHLYSSIEECKAKIKYVDLPVIFGDEHQIVRVFQNLIGNALKFRKEGIHPEIHISARRNDEGYIFSVADNGIGMEEQYFKKIFEPFKRLHTIDEYKGTGIGLSIVKRIIEHHNGRIWVESELGAGSIFYFTIPSSK